MKKKFLIFVYIIITLLCSGCWDYEEYEQMAQVHALGFDHEGENNIVTTAQYVTSAKKEGGSNISSGEETTSGQGEFAIRLASSKSVSSSIDVLQKVVDRQLFFGYTRVIVIGEQAAEKDIQRILSFLELTPYVRPSTYILICKGKASHALSTIDMSDVASSSREIEDMLFNSGRTGISYPISLQDFIKCIEREGLESVASQIKTFESTTDKSKTSDESNMFGLVKPKEGEHILSGMAAFKKYYLKGWLNEKESRGWGWIMNKKQNIHVSVNTGLSASTVQEELSFRILESKTNTKIILENKLPEIYVTTKIKAVITQFDNNAQLLSSNDMNDYGDLLADSIKSDIEAAIKKTKELNTDILGFGFKVFQQHTQAWQKTYKEIWDDLYAELPIHVEVKAEISSSGTKDISNAEK